MKNISWFVLIVLLTQACAVNKNMVPAGQYFGELPCADCPGINYSLTLNKDFTYTETTEYQGREAGDFYDSGKFELINDTIVSLSGKDEQAGLKQFVAKNNQLFILDLDGNPIESSYANWYILTKNKPAAREKDQLNSSWELLLINDIPIQSEDQAPYLEFQADEKRFVGFGGCNRITGPIEQLNNTLKFGTVIATKMACPNLETESKLLKLLDSQNWYFQIDGSTLILTRGKESLIFKKKN